MPAGEAIDLIITLPQGSLYKGALDPDLRWTPERYALADIYDAVFACAWRLSGNAGKVPQLTVRPGDVERQREAVERARKARAAIESTEWEDV